MSDVISNDEFKKMLLDERSVAGMAFLDTLVSSGGTVEPVVVALLAKAYGRVEILCMVEWLEEGKLIEPVDLKERPPKTPVRITAKGREMQKKRELMTGPDILDIWKKAVEGG